MDGNFHRNVQGERLSFFKQEFANGRRVDVLALVSCAAEDAVILVRGNMGVREADSTAAGSKTVEQISDGTFVTVAEGVVSNDQEAQRIIISIYLMVLAKELRHHAGTLREDPLQVVACVSGVRTPFQATEWGQENPIRQKKTRNEKEGAEGSRCTRNKDKRWWLAGKQVGGLDGPATGNFQRRKETREVRTIGSRSFWDIL